ncbi:hypothetical protein K431DRAFT_286197 [Polychaeton citri CBS 116435]|uniref:Ribosome biogenesis protein SLX9 n=1 Tax=Polychaeton citri CBS 116435 TaxID=1314669 RepID=A0A9P4UPI0_9PEZI|nr:hypothetical protein K431DRAFT_286197 [Polychaeton citri CBS 116435]
MAPNRMRARASSRTSSKAAVDPNSVAKSHLSLRADYLSSLPNYHESEDPFRTTKRDKRAIRHNALLAKVREGGISKGQGARKKRRRPAGQLKTGVADLGDALPNIDESGSTGGNDDEWEGIDEEDEVNGVLDVEGVGLRKSTKRRRAGRQGEGKMVMKSLNQRPGAMKRKARMERGEMERFGRNLAQMVGSGQAAVATAKEGGSGAAPGEGAGAAQADRWAALRKFIGGTMEKSAVFKES